MADLHTWSSWPRRPGLGDPEQLADRLFLVLEGSYVTGALEGDEDAIARARELAAKLVAYSVEADPVDARTGAATYRPPAHGTEPAQ